MGWNVKENIKIYNMGVVQVLTVATPVERTDLLIDLPGEAVFIDFSPDFNSYYHVETDRTVGLDLNNYGYDVYIKFDDVSEEKIYLMRPICLKRKFDRLYLTHKFHHSGHIIFYISQDPNFWMQSNWHRFERLAVRANVLVDVGPVIPGPKLITSDMKEFKRIALYVHALGLAGGDTIPLEFYEGPDVYTGTDRLIWNPTLNVGAPSAASGELVIYGNNIYCNYGAVVLGADRDMEIRGYLI